MGICYPLKRLVSVSDSFQSGNFAKPLKLNYDTSCGDLCYNYHITK